MENWQDEIIKAQISQEIGVERSMENSDISIFLKSFKENLIGAVDRDSFDKSWSSDLQSKFPSGSWRTVNGARVFINNGKVVAGLDGFNGEIDKFFEGRGKKEAGKSGDKKEEKFSDLQDKIDYYQDLSPAEKEKYRSETLDFIMDLKGRLSKTKDDKVKEVYEKQIRFSDKLLLELQKIKRKPVSDMTDDEFLELKNPYGSKWKDLFNNYSDQVKDAVKNKKFPSVEDAVKEVKKMEKTEREFGSEEKARLLGMVVDKFSKQGEGDTDKGSEDKGDNIPKSKDGLYQIYTVNVRNRDGGIDKMYGVPSPLNKGQRGLGDDLLDTLSQAIKTSEYNRHQEDVISKRKAEQELQKQKEEEESQAKTEKNKGKTKLEIMNEAKSQKVLNSKISIDGSIKTKKEHVQDIIRNGGKVGTVEVNKYKDVSRSRYNRMDGREQDELERKIKEGGKKTEYRLYTKDGSFYDISKTEYDYANQISNK